MNCLVPIVKYFISLDMVRPHVISAKPGRPPMALGLSCVSATFLQPASLLKPGIPVLPGLWILSSFCTRIHQASASARFHHLGSNHSVSFHCPRLPHGLSCATGTKLQASTRRPRPTKDPGCRPQGILLREGGVAGWVSLIASSHTSVPILQIYVYTPFCHNFAP